MGSTHSTKECAPACVSMQMTERFATYPNPGSIIAGAYFLFEPPGWTRRDNIVPSNKRKGIPEYCPGAILPGRK